MEKNRSMKDDVINIKINENIEKDQTVVAETMAEYFSTIADNIGVQVHCEEGEEEFSNHPSVVHIRNRFSTQDPFHNVAEIEESLKNLKTNKVTGWDQISPRILKSGAHELAAPLSKLFISLITSVEYPNNWKKGEWVPVYKKDVKTDKKNYRPITVNSITNFLNNNSAINYLTIWMITLTCICLLIELITVVKQHLKLVQ